MRTRLRRLRLRFLFCLQDRVETEIMHHFRVHRRDWEYEVRRREWLSGQVLQSPHTQN